MDKSVLVMNTPDKCIHCPLLNGNDECIVQDDDANASDSWDELMKGCPLMDLPEKDNGDYPANTFDAGFVEGWNQCIDEITGGNYDD